MFGFGALTHWCARQPLRHKLRARSIAPGETCEAEDRDRGRGGRRYWIRLGHQSRQGRFEQIKARADDLAHSPKVAETVQTLTETVKKNTHKLPDPVATVVNSAVDGVNETLQESKETQEP